MARNSRQWLVALLAVLLGAGIVAIAPGSAATAGGIDEPDSPAPLIYDGEVADSARGIVAIHKDGQYWCTGSLIAPRWVLTARHCVESYRDSGTITMDPITVRVKSLDREEGGGVIAVQRTNSRIRTQHDIAMLRLSRSANSPYYNSLATKHPNVGANGYIFAWGFLGLNCTSTSTSCNPARILRRGVVEFVDNSVPDLYGGTAIRSRPNPAATCPGDSGAPVFKVVDGARYQVGVHSYANAQPCGHATTMTHASVPRSLDWINKVMDTIP